MASRPYDLVLFGAYGYTGEKTAQHIHKSGPSTLKWAIAGRNETQLTKVATTLQDLASTASQKPGAPAPEVKVVNLEDRLKDFKELISHTKVFITAVGPYHKHGRLAFEMCAEAGTHYIDCSTGEVPWVHDMIERYDSVAQNSGAIMIPQCGIDSVPADLQTWFLAETARKELNVGLREVVNVCTEMSMAPSNGTVSTLLSLLDSYSILYVLRSMRPFALSPVPNTTSKTFPLNPISLLTGIWTYGGYKNLIQTPLTKADGSEVGRSWGLHDEGKFYGPNFKFIAFFQQPTLWAALKFHFGMLFLQLAMALPPLRKLLQMAPPVPTPKNTSTNRLQYHAIGTADTASGPTQYVDAKFRWLGDGYYLTGLLMAEAAFVLLEYEASGVSRSTPGLRPGVMTPSTLGQAYVDRLKNVNVELSAQVRENKL